MISICRKAFYYEQLKLGKISFFEVPLKQCPCGYSFDLQKVINFQKFLRLLFAIIRYDTRSIQLAMVQALKYDTIALLKETNFPVIIVAAVNESQAVYNSCISHGIPVVAFCDSIKEKASRLYSGLPVIHTPTLREHYENANFIIASQHIQDCIEQLTDLGYYEFYSPLELLESYDVFKHKHDASEAYIKGRIEVCINSHNMHKDFENKLYMRSLDLMITTKCTLRCESCCNLMPYYKSHSTFSTDSILSAIKVLSNHVNLISEFRIIGGEPLINKDWSKIAQAVGTNYPSQQIYIYTNGTICPSASELEALNRFNINFIITSYGKLSKRINEFEALLDRLAINYVINPAENWVDCSTIKHHNRTSASLNEVFKQCCVKYLYTLLHGKLYRCPFIANAANLSAIPDNPMNYIDLTVDDTDLAKRIGNFINRFSYFPGCDYCVGRPYDPNSTKGYDGRGNVTAGLQTKGLLPYEIII